jgi:succinate-semialdehyde dehydrogenase/glutarate-semialdehyde dehydrogenase
MKIADGFEPGAVIGPLIDMKAVEKVEAHIADAVKKGAKVVMGGKGAAQGGSLFEPTVLTDVTTDMVITKDETFGPIAPLYRFKTEAEAIKMANAPHPNPPPLAGEGKERAAAYFYSRDIGPIYRFTGAQNTASRNSSKSNTSAWAASTAEASPETGQPGSDRTS